MGRSRVVVNAHGLDLGGEQLPLVSGSLHYWRHPPDLWPDLLDAVAGLGFRVIDTYVPWSVHEREDGNFDFTAERDVEAFIRLSDQAGLKVLVRPGPHINAELSDYGFPRRVLLNPECQALGPVGTPVIRHSMTHFFPVPSYVSERFLSEVRGWFDAIVPRLAALQWPGGPIVACQVDNEMAYFFNTEPYSLDYRPEFVQQWREFSGHDGPAPVDGDEDADRCQSWVHFREVHLQRTIALLSGELRVRGMDRVPLYHNDCALGTPLDPAALERSGAVDVAGIDTYAAREDIGYAKVVARTLAGSSQLPFIPELGIGWIPDPLLQPKRRLPIDNEVSWLAAVLCGVRAWNFYMLVERERWYGSPISRRAGVREPDAELYRRMNRFLDDVDFPELRRRAPVLLLRNKRLERLAASLRRDGEVTAILYGHQVPAELRLIDAHPASFQRSPQELTGGFADAWRRHVEEAGLDLDEGSDEAPPDLDQYELIIAPTAPGFEPACQVRGLVTEWPSSEIGLPRARFTHSAHNEVSLHHFESKAGAHILGAINQSESEISFDVRFAGDLALRGIWREEELKGTGSVPITLAAHSGQVWRVVEA